MSDFLTDNEREELARYLAVDSANIPGAGAGVNRDSKNPDHAKPRSLYFGVYHNTGENAEEKPFRAALRVGRDKPRWINLGYFNCEIVAAIAYNVAAINMFGKGAYLNPVKNDMADPAELARFHEKRGEHIGNAREKMEKILASGEKPRYIDLNERAQRT